MEEKFFIDYIGREILTKIKVPVIISLQCIMKRMNKIYTIRHLRKYMYHTKCSLLVPPNFA